MYIEKVMEKRVVWIYKEAVVKRMVLVGIYREEDVAEKVLEICKTLVL